MSGAGGGEAGRWPGQSVEGLEGLALQCGLDPADPALASSCADVPEAGAERLCKPGPVFLVASALSRKSSQGLFHKLDLSFNFRNYSVKLHSAEEGR